MKIKYLIYMNLYSCLFLISTVSFSQIKQEKKLDDKYNSVVLEEFHFKDGEDSSIALREKIELYLQDEMTVTILMDEVLSTSPDHDFTGSEELEKIRHDFGNSVKVISFSSNNIANTEYDGIVLKTSPINRQLIEEIFDAIGLDKNTTEPSIWNNTRIIYVDDVRINLRVFSVQFRKYMQD